MTLVTPFTAQIVAIGAAASKLDDPEAEAKPIVAAPTSWLHGLAAAFGEPEGMIPQTIHGLPVVQNDAIDEPVIVTTDGKAYKVSDFLTPEAKAEEIMERYPNTLRKLAE